MLKYFFPHILSRYVVQRCVALNTAVLLCVCVLRDKHLFVVLHDGEDGVDGAEDSQGHHRLVLILFVLFTLKHSSEDLSLKKNKQKKNTRTKTKCFLLLYYLCVRM